MNYTDYSWFDVTEENIDNIRKKSFFGNELSLGCKATYDNDGGFIVIPKEEYNKAFGIEEKAENIKFDIPIYMDAISMFEYATGNNTGRYDVVDAVLSQIMQGDPVFEDVEEELNERLGDGAADHLIGIGNELKDYIKYTGVCEIDYEESDILVYCVSCEFDVDKYAEKFGLKELEEQEEDRDR